MSVYATKIEFKTPELEKQFALMNPAARAALCELAREVVARGLRHVVVTDLLRTKEDQRALYGDPNKFSHHLYGRAWDVRVVGGGETRYSAADAAALHTWLASHWPKAEVLLHGQNGKSDNSHLHFAIRKSS